jgi:hypothetical protein
MGVHFHFEIRISVAYFANESLFITTRNFIFTPSLPTRLMASTDASVAPSVSFIIMSSVEPTFEHVRINVTCHGKSYLFTALSDETILDVKKKLVLIDGSLLPPSQQRLYDHSMQFYPCAIDGSMDDELFLVDYEIEEGAVLQLEFVEPEFSNIYVKNLQSDIVAVIDLNVTDTVETFKKKIHAYAGTQFSPLDHLLFGGKGFGKVLVDKLTLAEYNITFGEDSLVWMPAVSLSVNLPELAFGSGKTTTLVVDIVKHTIKTVKEIFEAKHGSPSNMQRLHVGDVELVDDFTICRLAKKFTPIPTLQLTISSPSSSSSSSSSSASVSVPLSKLAVGSEIVVEYFTVKLIDGKPSSHIAYDELLTIQTIKEGLEQETGISVDAQVLAIDGLKLLNDMEMRYIKKELGGKEMLIDMSVDTDSKSWKLTPRLVRCNMPSCASTVKLKLCSACKGIYYCSVEHQRADWPRHKGFCAMVKKAMVEQLSLAADEEKKAVKAAPLSSESGDADQPQPELLFTPHLTTQRVCGVDLLFDPSRPEYTNCSGSERVAGRFRAFGLLWQVFVNPHASDYFSAYLCLDDKHDASLRARRPRMRVLAERRACTLAVRR